MEENITGADRRVAYRFAPPPVMEPLLSVICDGERVTATAVLDATLGGARVEFTGGQHGALTPGREVTASVQAPGLDGWADIPARIVFSAMQDGRHVVGLVFIEQPDLSDRATSAFFTVFNRREQERETAQAPERRVSARVLGDDRSATPLEVEVLNHSSKGLGFVVDKSLDERLRGRDSIPLAVTLPDGGAQTTVELRICHRATRTDAVYYGGVFA